MDVRALHLKQPLCLKSISLKKPTSLDPVGCNNLSSLFLARHLHEGLFRYEYESVVHALAERYEVLDQGLTYRIYLKEAYFSDGSKITAQDFINTAKRVLNPATPIYYAHLFHVIKNAQQIKAGQEEISSLGMRVISEKLFRIHP